MEFDLAQHVRARRSQLNNLASLRMLCIENVVHNRQYFEGKEVLFSSLPWTVLESLIELPAVETNPNLLKCVIQEQTQKLKIIVEEEDAFAELCQLTQAKCKNLRKLELRWNLKAKEKIHKLLSSLRQLRELDVSSHERSMDYDFLDTVSVTCSHLRRLRVYNILGVFCIQEPPERFILLYRNCPHLEEIRLPGWRINSYDLKDAINHLEKLRVLQFRGIENFVTQMSIDFLTLNLKEIDLREPNFDSGLPNNIELPDFLPNLQTLYLEKFSSDISTWRFEHLKHLKMTYMDCKISTFIQNHASKLTSVLISSCHSESLDLSMITFMCVNLEYLRIYVCSMNENCAYTLGPEHCTQLTRVELRMKEVKDESQLEAVLYRMLSSAKLISFETNCLGLSNTLACKLIVEAEENGSVFSELEHLYIALKDVSVETAIHLIAVIPKLKLLDFGMSNMESTKIWNFIYQNLPHIRILNR